MAGSRAVTIDAIIDLYHGNDVTDFAAVRASGVVAVILKCSQGASFVDPAFSQRADQAKAAGLLVGAYHFCNADLPSLQVSNFHRALSGKGLLLPVIDVEPNGSSTVSVKQAATIVLGVKASLGGYPVVYMGRYGPDGNAGGLPNATLSAASLWIPAYGSVPAVLQGLLSVIPPLETLLTAVGYLPRLPPGWATWEMWQYTETGSCPGIPAPVDRSRFNGTEAQLRAWWVANSRSM